MGRKIYTKKDPLLPLKGKPVLGESYHVAWSTNGVMGVCTDIDHHHKTVELSRPKTRVPFKNRIHFNDLRHTRAQQFRIELGKSPYPDRTHDVIYQKRITKFKLTDKINNESRD